MSVLRMGVLGAARILPMALLAPAAERTDVEVYAIASRDRTKAQKLADKHSIKRVYGTYQELLDDPDVDAVYIPLPNGLHGRWTIAALQSGKHVLCEKPFTANAEEAEAVREVARRSGLVCMEAFHYRYHALTQRALEIIASGELGKVERVETALCIPLVILKDIRWDIDLAGGSLMDVGCYAIHMLRTFAGQEPRVCSAKAKLLKPEIDRWVQAEMAFDDGATGSITAAMLSRTLFRASVEIRGSDGTMKIFNPLMPQYRHRIRIEAGGDRRVETVAKKPGTYEAQLEAFVAAVRDGKPYLTDVNDAVANMRVIDDCYRVAGLSPRTPTRS